MVTRKSGETLASGDGLELEGAFKNAVKLATGAQQAGATAAEIRAAAGIKP
jgi:hypothetical protein